MKQIITLILLLLVGFTYGQTQIKKSSISSGGGSASAGTITVISAIGEVAVQENTQGTVHLSEGFIGADIAVVLGVQEFQTLQGITILPNPVNDNLNIRMEKSGIYEIYLYDINGKQLLNQQITEENQAVYDLSGYATATYLLFVIDRENHLSKQIKIIKN